MSGTFQNKNVIKIPGHYSIIDWRRAIDSVWGPGLPTSEKLQIFDRVWKVLDSNFACFHNLHVNWDSLRTIYRSEVMNGVSRGRFAAIMMHLSLALKESHTIASDETVCFLTELNAGVPLLVVGNWGENGHFGAGLTPLPDKSLLVYEAVLPHPLGLVPGDIVLGYDSIPWKDLYKELIAAQLPITSTWWWGSSPSAFDHSFLMSVGMNWHLFDTIDIVKYAGGDTLHLSTAPLRNANMNLFCTEQLNMQGVPKPNLDSQKLITYGIIPGTNIGYIYGWGWFWNAEQEFHTAVQALLQTNGLIIDFRMNYGGNMFLSNSGLSMLFPEPTPTIDWGRRCDPAIHGMMCPLNISNTYIIPGGPPGYTKPIAVLTGPGALSSGDQVALRMKFHPRTKIFGKSTSTAFNSPILVDIGNPEWYFRYARLDPYVLSNPNVYLTHEEFQVDRSVWHTRSAVVQGRDNVVDAARSWIDSSLTFVMKNTSNIPIEFYLKQNYPNPFNPSTKIVFSIPVSGFTSLKIYNSLGQEVTTLLNENLNSGSYEITFDATHLASGIYNYQLKSGTYIATKKLLLVK